jgi:hypothetical protein
MYNLGSSRTSIALGEQSAFALAAAAFLVLGLGLKPAYAQQAPLAASSGQLTSALGALNAAHANAAALANAAPQSEVGKIATYDKAMLVALALPTATPAEITYRDQQIAYVRTTYLVAAANKPLSPAVVAKVDSLLGLPASDPSLGVVDTADTINGVGQGVGQGNVVHDNIDRPSMDRPSIDRPNINRPDIQRPNIQRPSIERPQIPH